MIDISKNHNIQQTIAQPVSIDGIGLHSGVNVSMKLYPAEADYGIKFIRTDLNNNNGARGQDHDSFTPYIIQRITDNHNAARQCQDPVFRSDTHFSYYNSDNGTVQNHFDWANTNASTSNVWKYNYWDYGGHSSNENITALRAGSSGSYRSAYRRMCGDRNDPSKLYVGGSMALNIVQDRHDRSFTDDSATIHDSKVCYISSTFNTGWLYGDVRAALLLHAGERRKISGDLFRRFPLHLIGLHLVDGLPAVGDGPVMLA